MILLDPTTGRRVRMELKPSGAAGPTGRDVARPQESGAGPKTPALADRRPTPLVRPPQG